MRALLLAALLAATPLAARAQTVMAAASLTDAIKQLAAQWTAAGHPAPKLVFGASSSLARQIEQGAPADIFISADEQWADDLQSKDLLDTASRRDVLGNTLVLIAPASAPGGPIPIGPGTDLMARIGPEQRLAVGETSSVPAGIYAKQALQTLGLWESVRDHLVPAESVRVALVFVARAEAPLGIVYATDAAIDPGVKIVGTFPEDSHPPITYPFALTRQATSPDAKALFAFLTGPDAAATYKQLGFTIRQ